MSAVQTEAVRKEVLVDLDAAAAFGLFTAGIARWWPVRTHSYGGDAVTSVVFEGRAGGRVYEVTDAGEQDWATVRELEPPGRFVLDWLIGDANGSEVEVRFEPEAGGTRVVLEHRGLSATDPRTRYDSGWDVVLAPFVEAAR